MCELQCLFFLFLIMILILYNYEFLGQIGVVDVADMVHCTLDAIDKNPLLDRNRVAVVGGSHGGLFATILYFLLQE